MAQSLRQDFNDTLSRLVLNDIQFQKGNYYYFLGNIEPWDSTDDFVPEDFSLEQVPEVDDLIRSGIIYAKKISPSEVSLTSPRHEWEAGVVFDQWDHTQIMINKRFFVVTEDYRVYKCLDNNLGSMSTVMPTGNLLRPLRTTDGYLWKYMFTIPEFKRKQFLSFNGIPVQQALSESFYSNGKIGDATVVSQGSGYVDQQLTTIVVTGTTTGSGAVGTAVLGPLGQITSVTINNGGTGYTKGVDIVFIGNGNGAMGTATIVAGEVTSITMTEQGVGYDGFTTVMFTLGGAVLYPVISRLTGSIESVTIVNPGTGYVSAPTLTLVEQGGSQGSGKYNGSPSAVLQAMMLNGKIDRVSIIDPGVDYRVDSATTITVAGDGTGAAFSPVVYQGQVVGVTIENRGTGYTTISLTVAAATGEGAVVKGIITPSDFESDQSFVEQTAVIGAIHNVVVTSSGANYSNQSFVTITGNGTGATLSPVIENGVLIRIQVDSEGQGYTNATITITDPLREEDIQPSENKAAAYAILPPVTGHGVDAVSELYADTLAISTSLRSDLKQYGLDQDYRTFGIIRNPLNLLTNNTFSSLESLVVQKLRFENVDGLVIDEILSQSNNKYRVADIEGNDVSLVVIDAQNRVPTGELRSVDGARVYNAVSSKYASDFNKKSGKLLYVSLERPFEFSDEQGLTIKTYINF